jgi:hypothetical protein
MLRSAVSNARWRGRAAALAAAMAAAVWLVVLIGMPEEADARSRFRTVTKTFFKPTSIQIPGANTGPGPAFPYPSDINAGGFRRGRVLDVNLTLWNFAHPHPDDVDVLLVHRGRNRTVMSDVGGPEAINSITLTLDDEAPDDLFNEIKLSSGTFKPTNVGDDDGFFSPAPDPPNANARLEGFDGSNPNGTWSLYAFNDDALGPGSFGGGWSLKIKAKIRR